MVRKLQTSYPEPAGFVFSSDDGHYNVIGNDNEPEFMAHPKVVTPEVKANGAFQRTIHAKEP